MIAKDLSFSLVLLRYLVSTFWQPPVFHQPLLFHRPSLFRQLSYSAIFHLVMIAEDFSSSLVLLRYLVSTFCQPQVFHQPILFHLPSLFRKPFLFRYLPSGHDCLRFLFQPRPTQIFSLHIPPTITFPLTFTIPPAFPIPLASIWSWLLRICLLVLSYSGIQSPHSAILNYFANRHCYTFLKYSASLTTRPSLFCKLLSCYDCRWFVFQSLPNQVSSPHILPTPTILTTDTIPPIVKNVLDSQGCGSGSLDRKCSGIHSSKFRN